MKDIDLMFQTSDIQEILTFDARIPREFHQDKWVPKTQQDFRNLSDRRCPVVELLLQDDIIEERGMPDDQRSIKHMIEPNTWVVLKLLGHASDVFSGTSDYHRWTEDFALAVEGRGGVHMRN